MTVLAYNKEDFTSFDDMILFYKRFLRLIGLLPIIKGQNFNHLTSRLHLICCLVWSFIYWSMIVFYMINAKKVPKIDMICEVIVTIGVTFRYYLLLFSRLELTHLLDESQIIWQLFDEKDRCKVRYFERKIRLLFKILLLSCIFINIMYSVSAILLTVNAINMNDNQTQYLPYKWYTENALNYWPGYKIIFVIQVLVIQNACIVASSVDTTVPLLITMAAGYFRALRYRLSRINDQSSNIQLEIIICLYLHQRIFNFCSRIERITRSLFFVQLICTVYNISLGGIKLASSDSDRYKFLSVEAYNLSTLFICQWAPDHLIRESAAISNAAYFVSATCMRHRLGKILVLMIARSQKPVQMTAAGIFNLSLENFRYMLTSAFSFFTVLRNVNL